MKRLNSSPVVLGLALLANSLSAYAVETTANDFGMTGAWQTPSARMRESGDLSFSVNQTEPYTRINMILQPFDWLQGGFRYIDVSNRLYGPSFAGNQTYKDKGIDVKFRLAKESRDVPELAVGFQDLGGTGLFAGEYVVASKQFGEFDLAAGLGWGYVGARGDFANPLSVVSDAASNRPQAGKTGDFNVNQFFRGRVSPFASLQYQALHSPFKIGRAHV